MTAPVRDRTRRIALFGSLAACAGVGGIALGLLHLTLPLLDASATDWRAAWMGLATWVPLGGVVLWTGLGALRLRRWARPVMLVLAWTWLITGAIAALWVAWSTGDLVILATASMDAAPPEGVMTAVRAFIVAVVVGGGVVLPAALVWGFTSDEVRATLDRRDPAPAWTDACPLSVLGLSLGLWLAALVTLPLALRPVVPLLGRLVTGPAAAALIVAGAFGAAWLGWLTYRVRPAGWWATTAALGGLGLSTAWTLARVDLPTMYLALGYPREYVDAMRETALIRPIPLIAATLGVTALSLAYMLAIRRAFFAARRRTT